MTAPIRTVLIANRGDAALRVLRTTTALGMRGVVTFAPDDRDGLHVARADAAVEVPSYLDVEAAVAAAVKVGAEALHPGWGFLAESAELAEACAAAGVIFVGPRPDTIRLLGNKITAKEAMQAAGVPTLDGGGWPRIVKAAAGGGGRGMRVVEHEADLDAALAAASREAEAAFGDGTVFTERYLPRARHVEVQIFGDTQGNVIHLGERECSIQRRHQKLLEETPSPGITAEVRGRLHAAAIAGARAVGYVGAGTFEFLVDGDDIAFLEVNTRLQVEHGITEAVTLMELVEEQLRVARGLPLSTAQDDVLFLGHAIEVRVVAEDPAAGWMPSGGEICRWRHADGHDDGIRWDEAVGTGRWVAPAYDSLLAKVITQGVSRDEVAARLAVAVDSLHVHGPVTNVAMLVATLRHPAFLAGDTTTAFLDEHPEVLDPLVDPDLRWRRIVAATLHGACRRHAAARVQAFVPPGFRNVPALPQRTTWAVGAETVVVTYRFDRFDGAAVTVAVGDEAGDVRYSFDEDGHVVELERGGLLTRHSLTIHGDRTFVDDHFGDFALEEMPRHPEPGAAAAGGGAFAPVPGTVLSVEVLAGQDVGAGDTLVVLEAMKMEHRITAPGDATVTEVLVAAGQAVDARQPLVVLEPRP